jgi:hypothetical protein
VHYFRVFGSVGYVHVPQECRGNLDDKAIAQKTKGIDAMIPNLRK